LWRFARAEHMRRRQCNFAVHSRESHRRRIPDGKCYVCEWNNLDN
jgi:hypothetical protein